MNLLIILKLSSSVLNSIFLLYFLHDKSFFLSDKYNKSVSYYLLEKKGECKVLIINTIQAKKFYERIFWSNFNLTVLRQWGFLLKFSFYLNFY